MVDKSVTLKVANAAIQALVEQRDALKEELRDEMRRGLALLADAKEWQAQLAKSEAECVHLRLERDALAAKLGGAE